MTGINKAKLSQHAAQIARTYGQVNNATWFTNRIAEHKAAGQHELAEHVAGIAASHGIAIAAPVKVAA
jgi:hypothetical protein